MSYGAISEASFPGMQMKKLLISMALVVMAASGAQAADPPMMVDPILADDPAMDWTGPYLGPRISVNSRTTRVIITDPAGIVFVGPNGPFDNTYSRLDLRHRRPGGYLFQTGRFVLGVAGRRRVARHRLAVRAADLG